MRLSSHWPRFAECWADTKFPLTTEIYLQDDSGRRRLGMLYAIDLLGGCLGALVLSGYMIPVFGFWKTAWLCMAVNLAPALLAAWACRESYQFHKRLEMDRVTHLQ